MANKKLQDGLTISLLPPTTDLSLGPRREVRALRGRIVGFREFGAVQALHPLTDQGSLPPARQMAMIWVPTSIVLQPAPTPVCLHPVALLAPRRHATPFIYTPFINTLHIQKTFPPPSSANLWFY